jgi:lysophospholipase L1-like esterase
MRTNEGTELGKSEHKKKQIIIQLTLALILASTALCETPNPIRIMPLGDSITYGIDSTYAYVGYRRSLYQSLLGHGYNVDFVGSQTDGSPADFDRNHEGHSGWRADQIRDSIIGWLNSNPPDVVLLHIGTNDISQGQGYIITANEIGEILDLIDAWEAANNDVWVVLSRIINRNDSLSSITTSLNGFIQNLADTRSAAGDKIIVVNMEGALEYPDDLDDHVHPNATGYGKMAAAWLPALENLPIRPPNPDEDEDGDIDGSDLAKFIAAFGSGFVDLNYNARCDLDSNGNINGDDLALFPPAFGYQESY